MLRRSIRLCGVNISGNRIVGIRREDKNVWERRAPLVPEHVQDLLRFKQVDKIVVQPSTTRCFTDQEYAEAGAEINEDLSSCGTVLAVKEVPGNLLLPDRSYMFFSHTIKAQPYNMPLLDTIVESNVRLFDYERILGPDGRIVKFGPQAGYAGVIDCLNALGLALMTRGFATPFLNVSLSREYRSLAVARESIRIAGDRIRQHGFPKGTGPLVFGVTGSGSVSMAAQEILHLLPCRYIEVEDLPKLASKEKVDNSYIYVCVIKAKDMVEHVDGKSFDSSHYYKNPQEYKPVFHNKVAPYLSVLITGHYWEPRFPRLLTMDQARHLHADKKFPLLVLADITCDIGGSIEFFVKSTSIQNPFYAYDLKKNTAMDIQDFHGEGIVILGVDHLPAEFPREASTSFGTNLKPLIPIVASSKADVSLDQQSVFLGKPLFNSMVTQGGKLTPNYEYITELRKKQEASTNKTKKVLIFGSGMMAAPCVFALLQSRENRITMIDASQHNLDIMHNALRKSEHDDDESRVRFVKVDATNMDSYINRLIKTSDVVVSLLPATMHPQVAELTLKHKVPLVTASYVSPGMEKLRETAKASGTLIVNEMGLDPGIDLMTSAKLLNEIKAEGGRVKSYVSLCGALPAPENSNCPMGYKFSWSPFGVLIAASRPAHIKVGGKFYDVPGDYLYYYPQPIQAFKGLDLYWLPNGIVDQYETVFGIAEASTIIRGTIRYAGFAPAIRAFKCLNLLDQETVMEELKESNRFSAISWPDLILRQAFKGQAVPEGCSGKNIYEWLPKVLADRLTERWTQVRATPAFTAIRDAALMTEWASGELHSVEEVVQNDVNEVMNTFSQLGLLQNDNAAANSVQGTPMHSLAENLIHHLSYKSHERDYVIMYHKIVAEFPEKKIVKKYDCTMTMRGKTNTLSATAETVGIPVGLTAQMVLEGKLDSLGGGIVSPTLPVVYEEILAGLTKQGISMDERVQVVPMKE